MAIELSGIENENDFYPSAFLTTALEEEIRGALARWKAEADDETAPSPVQRLASIGSDHQRLLARLRGSSNGTARETYRRLQQSAVTALGYNINPQTALLAMGKLAPLLGRVADRDGRDRLWIIEAPFISSADEALDPLGLTFASDQFGDNDREDAELAEPIEATLSDGVFNLDAAPRFVIVVSAAQIALVDRNKWPRRSVLRFNLAEIFSRNNTNTLQAMTCFLAREALAPEHGAPLSERLEEEAQRHANAVTSSLKRTVRDAIEILGNEVLAVTGGKYPTGKRKGVWIDGKDLSLECLRLMYRLLFLFYAEANPRLGIMPMSDPAYRSGYSLEALRGLEAVRLRTPEEREGHFIWESLQRVLGLLYQGLDRGDHGAQRLFTLPRVRVSLLDPGSTPILSSIKLRNAAMQEIIRKLSLKQDRNGAGRISYAQLGIGQLGAVYETLISFTGTVADTDLIELIPKTGRGADETDDEVENEAAEAETAEDTEANDETEADVTQEEDTEARHNRRDPVDTLAPTYFVAKSRAREFQPEQIVYDGPEPRIYKKGTFLYRLAGRDRQKSASYYTPEPLARLLVKHALLERCEGLSADELLDLKILEPAMGSAAFLVEATNQLADLYLERKQHEVGQRIPQEQYFLERQKVRAYIADRNCFGVDLNPIAVELGQISLWLNGLHSSEFTPWFGDQLHAGNSLLGARRAAYHARLLRASRQTDRWLRTKPEEIGWRSERPERHVWQFLLPAEEMANFAHDRSIEAFAKAEQEKIATWHRSAFFDVFSEEEVDLLIRLSAAVDELFEAVADDLKRTRAECNDEITIWPNKVMIGVKNTDHPAKRARTRVLHGEEHLSNSLPYQRLKTAMDAWCSLWLWPLDQVEHLPTRRQFLLGLSTILIGGMTPTGDVSLPDGANIADESEDLIERLASADRVAATLPSRARQSAIFQPTDIDALVANTPWLAVARDVAARERFTHFDLIFADVHRERAGFDLVVGNPPWAKPSWSPTETISDLDAALVIRSLTAPQTRALLPAWIDVGDRKKHLLEAFASSKGAMAITGSAVMNPHVGGGQNNLYRCFMDLSFRLLPPRGVAALIHQDGHLSDPKAGSMRRAWYSRVRKHFDFSNQIRTHNFAEVLNTRRFSLNIYAQPRAFIQFDQFTNAYLAAQVDESYEHDGNGEIPGLKLDGRWDTRGHRARIVTVNDELVHAAAKLLGMEEAVWGEAPLFQFLSAPLQTGFLRIAEAPTIGGSAGAHQFESLWHEGGAQAQGIIRANNSWPSTAIDLILTGPIVYWGNPYFKTPRAGCRSPRDYEVVPPDLIPDNYLPRSNYARGLDEAAYRQAAPKCSWNPLESHLDQFRVVFRRRVDIGSERSLSCAIIPKCVAHIDSMESVAFQVPRELVAASCLWNSTIADFVIKSLRQTNIRKTTISLLPWVSLPDAAIQRGLQLACLTSAYAQLWQALYPTLALSSWSFQDPRLPLSDHAGHDEWSRNVAARTPFARRAAMIEIDVLVSQAVGITLKQLQEIYRAAFPILEQNERGTWYDADGHIVWTNNKSMPRVGYLEESGQPPSQRAWQSILSAGHDTLECEALVDFDSAGPRRVTRRFVGPFETRDRMADTEVAWAYFERLTQDQAV